MNSIRNIARLNEAELEKVIPPNASWHTDYRDTAYIHIGGLPLDLSEGDVMLIFSQYGNPTDVKLARDKDSGKSRGFGWLKYEDQRSCDLAVDNLSGASVLGRLLSVDHARYKMKEGEKETVGEDDEGDETDREGASRGGKRRKESEESESEEERPMIKEEVELAKLLREHDEDDPMKAYLVREKRKEVEEALKAMSISNSKGSKKDGQRRKHRHRHRRERRDESEEGEERKANGHRSRRKEKRDGHESEDEDVSASKSSRRRHSVSEDEGQERRRRRDKDEDTETNDRHHKRSHRRHDSDSEDEHRRPRRSDND